MPVTDLPLLPPPSEVKRILVRTTLPLSPLPPNHLRQPITTPRLLIRPWQQSDLHQIRILRTQPEVMKVTRQNRIDLSLEETQAWLDRFLSPNDGQTHNFAIVLRETGELIGTGGVHSFKGEFGWPEIGYMFREEYWRKGFATEFLAGYMAAWKGLPRGVVEVEVEVDPRTTRTGKPGEEVEEQIIAITADFNEGSQKVLGKCGWEHFITWPGDDALKLPTFRWFPTRKTEEKGMKGVKEA
ncbi:GNAT domain-containing protein [Coniochaeta sp. 2T2.1]|nr:GNAT domain-containing protein [Coniochaeta sp. 2T2.1]